MRNEIHNSPPISAGGPGGLMTGGTPLGPSGTEPGGGGMWPNGGALLYMGPPDSGKI